MPAETAIVEIGDSIPEKALYTVMARDIRYQVFVQEQQVPEELEYDEFEEVSRHYLVFYREKAVATCRWRETAHGIKLERFAVMADARGKGFGALMVIHLLQEVLPQKKNIYLHAQEQVVEFYGKFGFTAVGPRFEEAGIQHFLMYYTGGEKKGNSS